jgi:hypothetical protein
VYGGLLVEGEGQSRANELALKLFSLAHLNPSPPAVLTVSDGL